MDVFQEAQWFAGFQVSLRRSVNNETTVSTKASVATQTYFVNLSVESDLLYDILNY